MLRFVEDNWLRQCSKKIKSKFHRFVNRTRSEPIASNISKPRNHTSLDLPRAFQCRIPWITTAWKKSAHCYPPMFIPFDISSQDAEILFLSYHQKRFISPFSFEFRSTTSPSLIYVPFHIYEFLLGFECYHDSYYPIDSEFNGKKIKLSRNLDAKLVSGQRTTGTNQGIRSSCASYEFRNLHLNGISQVIPNGFERYLTDRSKWSIDQLKYRENLEIVKDPVVNDGLAAAQQTFFKDIKALYDHLSSNLDSINQAIAIENLMISNLSIKRLKTRTVYIPFYYFENYWNSVHFPTYVHGYTGEVWSPGRVVSPTKSAIITSSALLSYFSWSATDGIQMPQLHETMDALISGLTVACAWWFYPQLKLIGMDDKRIEELRPADHPVAQDADEQKRSLDDKKDGESDQLNSAHAPPIGDAKSTAPSANERTAESTQTFTGPHFTDDEFINRQFDAWESENNDDSFKSQPDYSADKARQAMLDALKRLEELKSDRSSDTEEDNNEPATTAAAAANRQQLDIDPKGYYAYLGLQGRERLATVEEIRIAFRRMARIYHPDLETDLQSKKQAKIKFQKLVQVYSVLRDAEKRQAYDSSAKSQSN